MHILPVSGPRAHTIKAGTEFMTPEKSKDESEKIVLWLGVSLRRFAGEHLSTL